MNSSDTLDTVDNIFVRCRSLVRKLFSRVSFRRWCRNDLTILASHQSFIAYVLASIFPMSLARRSLLRYVHTHAHAHHVTRVKRKKVSELHYLQITGLQVTRHRSSESITSVFYVGSLTFEPTRIGGETGQTAAKRRAIERAKSMGYR